MALSKHLKPLVFLSILIGGACLVLFGAFATEAAKSEATTKVEALGERANSLGDALEKANAYSFKTGGIGIIISYGTGNSGTPERIGNLFVQEIEQRGQKARYFSHDAEWPGVTMSYRIGYSSLGPWNVDEAAKNIGEAVEMAIAARKVHDGKI